MWEEVIIWCYQIISILSKETEKTAKNYYHVSLFSCRKFSIQIS